MPDNPRDTLAKLKVYVEIESNLSVSLFWNDPTIMTYFTVIINIFGFY